MDRVKPRIFPNKVKRKRNGADRSSAIKTELLGMPYGTASNRLRKNLMFSLVVRLNLNVCHHCGTMIDDVTELSIEHKVPWQKSDDPIATFFDLKI